CTGAPSSLVKQINSLTSKTSADMKQRYGMRAIAIAIDDGVHNLLMLSLDLGFALRTNILFIQRNNTVAIRLRPQASQLFNQDGIFGGRINRLVKFTMRLQCIDIAINRLQPGKTLLNLDNIFLGSTLRRQLRGQRLQRTAHL